MILQISPKFVDLNYSPENYQVQGCWFQHAGEVLKRWLKRFPAKNSVSEIATCEFLQHVIFFSIAKVEPYMPVFEADEGWGCFGGEFFCVFFRKQMGSISLTVGGESWTESFLGKKKALI